MKMLKVTNLIIILLVAFHGLNAYSQSSKTKVYIKKYKDIAVKEMKRTGVPASITLAQGILESNSGQSRLAVKGNNHFGIKCHSDWKGRKIIHDDDKKNECFRKYRSAYDSYKDHSDFIKNGQRYSFLFNYKPTDYKSWAKGLKKANYATEKRYAELLIDIIEDYELYKYDSKKGRKKAKEKDRGPKQELADIDNLVINPFKEEIQTQNRINYIVVKKGDTFYGIAKKFDVMLWQLYKYNELEENAILKPGQILYLQPKRNKAEAGKKHHTVGTGETMYSISQLYGIKLKRLYKKNNLKFGDKAIAGHELNLRKKKNE